MEFSNVRRATLFAAIASTTLAAPAISVAQAFPNKPIHFVVPYPPGGGNDDVARLIGRKLSENIGQPVIIENRAGASGMIAGDYVARAAPDGYTIMIDHSGIVINPALYPNITYNVMTDLAPITLAVSQGTMFLVNPSVPAKNISELISYAKSQPGKLNYASPGNGTPQHIAMVQFNQMAGVDIVHIPYKGGAPATTALIAGEVQILLSGTSGLPFVKAGKARVIATTGATRSVALPDVPTAQESGLKGYTSTVWLGIFAPAKTTAPIVERLNQEIVKVLSAPEVQQQLADRNFDVVKSTPQEFAKVIERDVAQFGKIVKEFGIKPD